MLYNGISYLTIYC